jgi:hypothetical protein
VIQAEDRRQNTCALNSLQTVNLAKRGNCSSLWYNISERQSASTKKEDASRHISSFAGITGSYFKNMPVEEE